MILLPKKDLLGGSRQSKASEMQLMLRIYHLTLHTRYFASTEGLDQPEICLKLVAQGRLQIGRNAKSFECHKITTKRPLQDQQWHCLKLLYLNCSMGSSQAWIPLSSCKKHWLHNPIFRPKTLKEYWKNNNCFFPIFWQKISEKYQMQLHSISFSKNRGKITGHESIFYQYFLTWYCTDIIGNNKGKILKPECSVISKTKFQWNNKIPES